MITVYEAGNTLIASLIPNADKVRKVTIVPRGQAMGYTISRLVWTRRII